jgi:hypothetical protein
MKDELQNYMDQPKRYNNIDGTGEMAMGLMALGYGLLGCLQAVLPENSMWRHGFNSMVLFFAFILLMFGVLHWGPKAIKKRITWPRTGYVAYRVGGKSWWTMLAAVAAFSAIVAVGLGCLMRLDRQRDWMSLMWLGNVVILVAGYGFWICRFSREQPWKWLVLLFMALGLLAIGLIARADFMGLWRPMLLFVGLAWIGSGAATLYLYIRHTQPPAPETE